MYNDKALDAEMSSCGFLFFSPFEVVTSLSLILLFLFCYRHRFIWVKKLIMFRFTFDSIVMLYGEISKDTEHLSDSGFLMKMCMRGVHLNQTQ